MKLKITKIAFSVLFVLVFSNLKAQQWQGRTQSNYSGTYGVYNNAASIADNKYLYYFNFWGRGVNFYNNFLDYNAPLKLNKWANDNNISDFKDNNENILFKDDWFLEKQNGKDKYFSFNQDIFGPAFMFPVSKNANLSINTRQRSGMQMFGFNENIARMAKNGFDSSGGIYSGANGLKRNQMYSNKNFGANAISYQELSFTLGGILHKDKNHQWNGGATLKLIRGLGAAYIKGSDLGISINGNNSAQVSGNFDYAYTSDKAVVAPFNDPYGVFALKSKGVGAGFDLALSYSYVSERLKYKNNRCNNTNRKSDYDFKIAMAINDIGGVHFDKASNKYTYNSSTPTFVSAPNNILNSFKANSQNAFDTIGNKVFGAMGATKSSGFSTSLPAAFNLQADFRISKYFFTSINWNQSLKGYNTAGLRSTSMLSIMPRIESRGFEFSMPLTLNENYKNFHVGAYARIGPVFFGSDNLGGLLNVAGKSQFSGADIYGGVSFGIGHCLKGYVGGEAIVEPTRDTIVQKDSLISKDTVVIIKRDTIFIDKTKYTESERTIIEKEKEIIRKQKELEKRERELLDRERNTTTGNSAEALRICRNNAANLTVENNRLITLVSDRDRAIENQRRQMEIEKNKNKNNPIEPISDKKCADEVKKRDNEIIYLNAELEKIKRSTENQAEIIRKAQLDKEKVDKEAIVARRQLDSLRNAIAAKQVELDKCKIDKSQGDVKKCEEEKALLNLEMIAMSKRIGSLNTTIYNLNYAIDSFKTIVLNKNKEIGECNRLRLTHTEKITKLELDKAKAEAEAEIARKKVVETERVLANKILELENCKKNNTNSSAEVVKNLEAEKAKAQAEAEIAKKKTVETEKLLADKTLELENCRKTATGESSDVIKTLEGEKSKAQAEAEVAKKKSIEAEKLLADKITEIEKLKLTVGNCDEENAKLKKCQAEKDNISLEMKDMANRIGQLNTKNADLSYQIKALEEDLAKCKSGSGGLIEDGELKKCQDAEKENQSKIEKLNSTIFNNSIEINKLNDEKTQLQKSQTAIDKQLKDLKIEYNFMLQQNRRSKSDLDTCRRGLKDIVPDKKGDVISPPSGNDNREPVNLGNKNQDSILNNVVDNETPENKVDNTPKKVRENVGLKVLGDILGAVLESAAENSNDNNKTSTDSGTTNRREGSGTTGSTEKPKTSNAGSTEKPKTSNDDWYKNSTTPASPSNKPTEQTGGSGGTNTPPSGGGGGSTRRR